MSASMPTPYWPVRPPHQRSGPVRTPDGVGGPAGPPSQDSRQDPPPWIRRNRPPLRVAVDVVARFGTAVTLAALLVVTAAALGAADDAPAPAGVTTTQR